MDDQTIIQTLQPFFPKALGTNGPNLVANPDGARILDRIRDMSRNPIHVTSFNQLLHLIHEAGVTDGFFKYYFQVIPERHPYRVDHILSTQPVLDEKGVSSITQLEWGIRRFFVDALLYWGNIRTAYRELRVKTYEELENFFSENRFPSEELKRRGPVLPFQKIPVDDRYLISEIACKAYSPIESGDTLHIEDVLLRRYKKLGEGRVRIASLMDLDGSPSIGEEPHEQLMLDFLTEEIMEEEVQSEAELREKVQAIAERFSSARDYAIQNTRLYLSIVNELDVYVATSMRRREDFRNMAKDCQDIFGSEGLGGFRVRYFDPTMSAAQGHEDKGLLECLMVKCAKVVLYFAGERDSFGKDAEVAMALSLGKPVIILCPETREGEQREKFFRDIHPLSRLVHFESGVPIGAMVTRRKDVAAKLLERIFDNRMEYDFDQKDGYYRLKERLTGSVVRLQTNWAMLREAFFNYYHGVP